MAAHLGGAVRVEAGAGGRQPDADPLGEPGGDLAERRGVRGAHVAVPQGADEGGQRLGEMAHVRVQRGAVGERPHHHREGVGQFGEQAALGERGDLGERRGRPRPRDSALAVAAESTVVPHTPASATRTDSSGSQRSRQVSRNVPVLPREAAGLAPADAEQPQPVQQPAARRVGVLAQVQLQLPLQRPPA